MAYVLFVYMYINMINDNQFTFIFMKCGATLKLKISMGTLLTCE